METDFNGTEFEKIRAAEPPVAHLEAIRNQIIGSLRPVKPLPSDRGLVTTLTAGFICLGVLYAIPIGLKGYHAMTTAQKLADYAAILFCALILVVVLTWARRYNETGEAKTPLKCSPVVVRRRG
jgi:hypothetical protein